MKREEALKIMELEAGVGVATTMITEKEITKRYRKLALKRHPDKPGGTKEDFQQLVNAYEFLLQNLKTTHDGDGSNPSRSNPVPGSTSNKRKASEHQEEEEDDEYWSYSFHFNFFSRGGYYSSRWEDDNDDDDDRWEEFFQQQRETARRRYDRQRRENLRNNYDYRDRKWGRASGDVDSKKICSFCGTNSAIDEEDGVAHGIDWKEYSAHPEDYQTCWNCKNKHISVMTESMAIKKFAKKLEPMTDGRYGQYRFLFWLLKKEDRAFHHQPKTVYYDGPTKNSLYYWYPDLEDAALAAGWKPRGKKKEEVPWRRKDYPNAIVPVMRSESSPPSTPKKKRQKKSPTKVTPEN